MQQSFWEWFTEAAKKQGFTVLLLMVAIFYMYIDRKTMIDDIKKCQTKTDELYQLVIKNNEQVINKNTQQLHDFDLTVKNYFHNQ